MYLPNTVLLSIHFCNRLYKLRLYDDKSKTYDKMHYIFVDNQCHIFLFHILWNINIRRDRLHRISKNSCISCTSNCFKTIPLKLFKTNQYLQIKKRQLLNNAIFFSEQKLFKKDLVLNSTIYCFYVILEDIIKQSAFKISIQDLLYSNFFINT